MTTTKLSSKGQIIIPKWLRERNNWQTGMEFVVVDAGDGIFLRPQNPFAPTIVDEVAGILAYGGPAKTLEEMEEAIAQGVAAEWNDRR